VPLENATMTKLNELKAKRNAAKEAHKTLVAAHVAAAQAGDTPRAFSAEEKAAQAQSEGTIAALDEIIGAQESADRLEIAAIASGRPSRVEVSAPNFTEDPRKGFRTHREMLGMVIQAAGLGGVDAVQDERLRYLAVNDDGLAFMLPVAFTPPGLVGPRGMHATVGSDEQGVYDDRYGGFSVGGPTFLPGVMQIGFEGDPTAGRTQAVPMATPSVKILARNDKDHTGSVSGGFQVYRRAEAAAMTTTRAALELIQLTAASLFGAAYATNELLADSLISFMAFIQAGFNDQFAHRVMKEKLRGLGGDQFEGILSSPATVTQAAVSGQGAGTLVVENAIAMRSRCWGYANAIWLANHDTYPQLAGFNKAFGTAGALVYQPSVVEDRPDTLLGRPIFYSEFASKLGDAGDLMLLNMSQYLEGVYQPLQSAESIHVRFDRHETMLKFWLRNAGAPWWRVPLTPEQSTVTLSPFVILSGTRT